MIRSLDAMTQPRFVHAASNAGAAGAASLPQGDVDPKKRVPITVIDADTGKPLQSSVSVAPSSSVFTATLKKPLGLVLAGGGGGGGAGGAAHSTICCASFWAHR